MALLEEEAVRFAEALDDYEDMRVTDIGGNDPAGYWVMVLDDRFDLSYEIATHVGYWDILTRYCASRPGPSGLCEADRRAPHK